MLHQNYCGPFYWNFVLNMSSFRYKTACISHKSITLVIINKLWTDFSFIVTRFYMITFKRVVRVIAFWFLCVRYTSKQFPHHSKTCITIISVVAFILLQLVRRTELKLFHFEILDLLLTMHRVLNYKLN